MKIRDIMRSDFARFHANDSLKQVLFSLTEKKITSAPVFDDGELVGIVSAETIAKRLNEKGFTSLWQKDKVSPLDKMNKLNAGQLCRKVKATLKAEQDLSSALGALLGEESCIPVFEGKRMVGLVRSEDLLRFFMAEFAKGAHSEKLAASADDALEKGERVDTVIDGVLAIVRRDKETTAKKIAAELGISQKSVEKLGETLHQHRLIQMEYSFLKGATLRLIRHGQG